MPKKKKHKRIILKKATSKLSGKTIEIMEKQVKFLKDIVGMIAGQSSEEIVDLLYKKENVNEFDIAKRLDLTINQARNILYKLSDQGLVSFTRKKDKKNGGWYTYFWTLDIWKSFVLLRKKMTDEIEHLENQLSSKEAKRFYHCKNCDIEINEENSLIYDFTCPECGEVFDLKNNAGTIEVLKGDVEKIRDKLKLINEEIMGVEKKAEIAKKRRLKVEEKKKKIARSERRKALAKLREKEANKIGKKTKGKIQKSKKKTKIKKSVKKKIKKRPLKKKKDEKKPVKKKYTRKKPVKKQRRRR